VYGNAMAYSELLYATGTLTPMPRRTAMRNLAWASCLPLQG